MDEMTPEQERARAATLSALTKTLRERDERPLAVGDRVTIRSAAESLDGILVEIVDHTIVNQSWPKEHVVYVWERHRLMYVFPVPHGRDIHEFFAIARTETPTQSPNE